MLGIHRQPGLIPGPITAQRILDKPGRSVSNSDQAISLRAHDGERERATGPGLKPQASSSKLQAPTNKRSLE